MKYENNDRLREYLDRGAAGAYREHLRHPRFEFNEEAFAAALDLVRAQFPDLSADEAEARAAFRLLTSGVAPEVAVPLPSRWFRCETFVREKSIQSWPWLKLAWAVAVLLLCAAAVLLLSALVARAEPTPQSAIGRQAIRRALRGVNLLALPAAPQQPGGIILQFQQGGSALATRPAGLVALNCSTGMSCSFSGTTFTLTSTGGGGTGCVPPGTATRLLYDDGLGGCLDTGLTWTGGNTVTAPTGITLTYSGTGSVNARNWAGTSITNTESLGKIPIGNGDGTATWSDPFVSGITAHDAVATSTNPVLVGGYASAAAPSDVSADGDAVRAWHLRNGSQVINLAAAGALIPGDATNGLKVQVATMPVTHVIADSGTITAVTGITNALPAGTNVIGHVITDTNSTTAVTQATAANLNATVVGTGTFAVQAASTLAAETTKVIGTVRNVGNVGGVFDAAQNAATPANNLAMGCNFTTSPATLTTGNLGAVQCNNKGEPLVQLTDGTTNVSVIAGTNAVKSDLSSIAGSATLTGNGASGTGAQRVSISSDNSAVSGFGVGATGSAVPANASYTGGNASGNLVGYENCNGYAFDRSTTADVQLVAISGSTNIIVCGYTVSGSSSTTSDVNLRWATNANCTTGATNLTPARTVQAATSTGPIGIVVMPGNGYTGLNTGASHNLCVHRSAAVQTEVEVWYSQR